VTKLKPKLCVVCTPLFGEAPETIKVGCLVEHQITGLFGIARGALNLSDDG
jgi:hypothetical protein